MSSLINYNPYSGLLSCHCKHLLRALMSSFYGSIVYTTYNRLNKALGYNIKAIYALRAYYIIYCSYGMASFYTLPYEFVVSID